MRPVMMLVFLAGCLTSEEISSSAETNARTWTQEMGEEIKGVSCSGQDSGADGYVSCTVSLQDGRQIPIECGYNHFVFIGTANSGCKEVRPLTVHQE